MPAAPRRSPEPRCAGAPGETWRQAGHHLGRACVRREIPVDEPRALVDEGSIDPEGRLLARAALGPLAELSARHRELLRVAAGPRTLAAHARAHGLGPATAAGRLPLARSALAGRIARRCW